MRERAQRFDPRQNMHRSTFEVFHYREPKAAEVEVHHHDFYEVYFLLSGSVSYWSEGQIYSLQPGDLLLMDPMVLHRPITVAYERIVLWIDKNYLERLGEQGVSLAACFGGTRLLRPTPGQRAELLDRFGALVREHYGDSYGSDLYAQGIFLQLMAELNRLSLGTAPRKEEQESAAPLVKGVLEYIGEHYQEELSLELLAGRFYVSKYHLSHEFSKAVGTGVYRYIMLRRLMAAKQLLSEGVAPGDAALRCGFRDYTNFYRAFKAEYGTAPRSFAEEVR